MTQVFTIPAGAQVSFGSGWETWPRPAVFIPAAPGSRLGAFFTAPGTWATALLSREAADAIDGTEGASC